MSSRALATPSTNLSSASTPPTKIYCMDIQQRHHLHVSPMYPYSLSAYSRLIDPFTCMDYISVSSTQHGCCFGSLPHRHLTRLLINGWVSHLLFYIFRTNIVATSCTSTGCRNVSDLQNLVLSMISLAQHSATILHTYLSETYWFASSCSLVIKASPTSKNLSVILCTEHEDYEKCKGTTPIFRYCEYAHIIVFLHKQFIWISWLNILALSPLIILHISLDVWANLASY
jgi:hypothetical protein